MDTGTQPDAEAESHRRCDRDRQKDSVRQTGEIGRVKAGQSQMQG